MLRDRVNEVERSCYEAYMTRIESSITETPKVFWSYIKSKRTNSNYPSNMSYNGTNYENGQDICESFSAYFSSTFLAPLSSANSSSQAQHDISSCYNIFESIEIDPIVVNKHLKALDLNKSAGPDSLPAIFFVKCADVLTEPVTLFFRRSLAEGVMPARWKSAFITPIHKKGAKTEIVNYRPISKLCILAKLLERIVYDQLYNSLSASFLPQQHGFIQGKSTVSNLMLFTDFVSGQMDDGAQIDAVYTDYSKAFDRVDHDILLRKLFELGIRGDLYRWFSSYVRNRTQAVVLSGYTSAWIEVPSSVPQGSLIICDLYK